MRRWIRSFAARPAAAAPILAAAASQSLFGRRYQPLPLWKRVLFVATGVPLVVAGGGASAYYLHLHRWADSFRLSDLPCVPTPKAARRILVLSPHCDDETLGVGAMIADARQDGVPVTVAFLTNGDGFRVAASRELREVALSPTDFVRFAELRQRESLAALSDLGVRSENVQFLGYPDRGLKPMWEENWSPATPFRSAYTQRCDCPYPRAYSPHSLYCGRDLYRDLIRLMRDTRPTDIYVTHPSDDHPDHSAAAAYAEAALRACQEEKQDSTWAPSARLHYYIVHRGDWPLPQGFHPKRPLLPPPSLARLDTRWYTTKASSAAVAAKQKALECYVSQISVEGRFLRSFLRTNELVGDLADSDVCPDPPLAVTASLRRPEPVRIALDPVGDDLVRYATPGADLTGISVQKIPGQEALQITVTTHGQASRRVHYTLLLRAMGGSSIVPPQDPDTSGFVSLSLTPAASEVRAGSTALHATIALRALGLRPDQTDRVVWVCAETRLSSHLPVIDRTGYRAFDIPNAPTPAFVASRSASPLSASK